MTYASEVLADSPVVWWPLSDTSGTTAVDSSGNAKDGTYSGSPALGAPGIVTGAPGTAVAFDGADDIVSVADATVLTEFAAEVWLKTTGTASSTGATIVSRYNTTASQRIFELRLNPSGQVQGRFYNSAGSASSVTGSSVADDLVHHVVITFAGGDCRLYVDGTLQASGTRTGALSANAVPFRAGNSGGGTEGFPGTLAHVAYYPTALSATRVADHYNAGIAPPPPVTVTPTFIASTATVPLPTLDVPTPLGTLREPTRRTKLSQAVQVRVGGVWLSTIAGWGDLEVKHGRNGSLEASWEMTLRPTQRPAALVRGAWVQIYAGAHLVWSGTLAEPDWDSKTFVAIGLARAAEGAECLDASGNVTSKPNTAIDYAITRGGVPWARRSDFGNTDLAGPEGGVGVDDPDPGMLNELLNLRSTEEGDQWYVAPDKVLTIVTEDESVVDWMILPGVGVLGVADDNVTDRVFLRYLSSVDSRYRTASYPATTPDGGIERRASVIHLGPMTETRATTIAEGMYRKAQEGRTGWTNGIEVSAGQIITPGGLDANLALIRAGQTVRLLDTPDPRGVGRNLDVVLEETIWRPSERTIQLNPVALAARTWEHVMEEANARGDS